MSPIPWKRVRKNKIASDIEFPSCKIYFLQTNGNRSWTSIDKRKTETLSSDTFELQELMPLSFIQESHSWKIILSSSVLLARTVPAGRHYIQKSQGLWSSWKTEWLTPEIGKVNSCRWIYRRTFICKVFIYLFIICHPSHLEASLAAYKH